MSDLMQKKLGYFMDMKKITASYKFTGDESEADDYISMIDKREYILEKIDEIDRLLNYPENQKIADNPVIKNEIEATIKEIVEMDKKNKVFAERIKQNIGLKIGELKMGKRLSTAYSNDNSYYGMSSIDSKR